MGSPWLATGPYSVKMKRMASKKLFKYLPGPLGAIFGTKTTGIIQNLKNLIMFVKNRSEGFRDISSLRAFGPRCRQVLRVVCVTARALFNVFEESSIWLTRNDPFWGKVAFGWRETRVGA